MMKKRIILILGLIAILTIIAYILTKVLDILTIIDYFFNK